MQDESILVKRDLAGVQLRPAMSIDDLFFTLQAPTLLLAAIAASPAEWPRYAELIRKGTGRLRQAAPIDSADVLAGRLGMDVTALLQAIDGSRTGRIEHLIHCFKMMLYPDWRPPVQLQGLEHLERAKARGKGAVLWVSHFCFSSLMTKMNLSKAGFGHCHISRPEHGISKSRLGVAFLNKVRVVPEDRFLDRRLVHDRRDPGKTREIAVQSLRDNGLVSITVGAWEGRKLISAPLIGGHFRVGAGAPSLAYHNGASLLPVFTLRDREGSYRTTVGPPLAEDARERGCDSFLKCAGAQLMDLHLPLIRQNPDQWRGWKDWSRQNAVAPASFAAR